MNYTDYKGLFPLRSQFINCNSLLYKPPTGSSCNCQTCLSKKSAKELNIKDFELEKKLQNTKLLQKKKIQEKLEEFESLYSLVEIMDIYSNNEQEKILNNLKKISKLNKII